MSIAEELEQEAAEQTAAAEDIALDDAAIRALELEDHIKDLEQKAKDAKAELERIMKHILPEKLRVLGVDEYGFMYEGRRRRILNEIKVKGSFSAAPDQEAATAYLETNGFAGGVKTSIEMSFTEDDREDAEALFEELTAKELPVTMSRDIHPSTLASFAKAKLADDPNFNVEIIGLRAWPQAKFTLR